MISTGIQRLDDILKGGIREEHSVMFSGLFDEDHRILMHQFVFSLLSQDYKVLLVEFKQTPRSLIEWVKEYGIDYSSFMESEKLRILDGYTNIYSKMTVSGKDMLPNPLDLPITTAIIRDILIKEKYDFLVIDDLSILYAVLSSKEEFFKIIVRFINSISLEHVSTVASFMEELTSPDYYSLLTLPFGYVISVKNGKIHVLKAPHPLSSVTYFTYVKTERGIQPYGEYYETVERLKESLFLDEEGMLWAGNERVQLVEENSEATLIEGLFEYLGEEEAKRFLYFWGRKSFQEIGKIYAKVHKSLRHVLEKIFDETKISGGGMLEILQFSNDMIVIKGKNLFPRMPNFGSQVHLHYAGALAQIVEEISGSEWEGHEVKCEAKGDSYCEFVIKRKEE
ncbi:ATPase domain-containing protein [Thermococcus sp. SY098]|uniref:ATPase domain-containing protein n=1 Tax=Thermococcus sp. SY098 TaxID=3111325 RepID=UPI002D7854B1|nr:ATPase domain-containing protein [Thermococcus sp. SY098]WRS52501.1 ATPase domain-containing protein [Thermococcus sp. SY098]